MNAPAPPSALPDARPRSDSRSLTGWLLVAGFALAALGLSAESSAGQDPGQEPDVTSAYPPLAQGYGTSDSNGSMIAVTGVDVTGGSLLYLVDTERRHLTIYQATGGTKSTMNVRWVGARNIDLDLQVDGWNDESEYSYKELAKAFEAQGPEAIPDK